MNFFRFVYFAPLIFILSITLVLSSFRIVPKPCKAALAMAAEALSDVPIRSAMKATDGTLMLVREIYSSFNFDGPRKFIFSCTFKRPGKIFFLLTKNSAVLQLCYCRQ